MVAVVQGTMLTALAQGFAAGLTYGALGVPFAVFLGALSAILFSCAVRRHGIRLGSRRGIPVLDRAGMEGDRHDRHRNRIGRTHG